MVSDKKIDGFVAREDPVLILVLMEYGLGLHATQHIRCVLYHVLILVLMEYGLGHVVEPIKEGEKIMS